MKKTFLFLILLPLFYVLGAERQIVISKIDIGLQNSTNYQFGTLSPTNTIKGLNSTALDSILEFETSSDKDFTYNSSTERYSYPYSSKESYIMFPVNYNNSPSIKTGNIRLIEEELTDTNDILRRVIIDETINLPASLIELSKSSDITAGDLFTYSENQSIVQQHFERFKNQEYMIRISKGTGDFDYDPYNKSNRIKQASSNDTAFLNGTLNYIDFYFSGDDYTKLQKIITNQGLQASFVPGRIEIFGLPQGNYTITLYSFRYSTEFSDKGNVVITRESKLNFNSKTIDITKNLIIRNLDTTAHPTISGELILISNTVNPSYTIRERQGSTGGFTNISPTSTMTALTSTFYYNSTTSITPDSNGLFGGKYYYKVNFNYTSPFTTKNSTIRNIEFKSGTTTEVVSYYAAYDTLAKFTNFPYQTLIAQWKVNQDFGSSPFTINDKLLSPTTYGYRGVKYINSSTIKDAYLGNYSNSLILNFNNSTYSWEGNSGTKRTLMIQKIVADSKGIYRNSTKDYFNFYTLKNLQNLSYEQESLTTVPENASFLWQDSPRSTFGVIVSDEELIFRITRLSSSSDTGMESKSYSVAGTNYTVSLPKFYLDLYNNINPIGNYNETTNIESFVAGNKNYLDLIFKKGEDRKIERANAIFSFFKENKFDIMGLPRGNYMVQIYSVKGADLETQKVGLLDYKAITYEFSKKFEIGLPELVYGNFASMNNLFLIESINVTSSFDINTNLQTKKINVNFVTKTSEEISLTKDHLSAQNLEETGGGPYAMPSHKVAERHQNGTITPIGEASLNVYRADKAAFQFPLDIIFLVDNSGSMQEEIDNVKNGLQDFTNNLEARGYNVKFNLISFGPAQNGRYSAIGNNYPVGSWVNKIYQYQDRYNNNHYLAIYKQNWFDNVGELIGAFDELRAIGGYYAGQENGAQAIYNGATLLKNNGRYLDYNNNIVDNNQYQSGFIPSKKLLILLSDENFDTDNLSLVPGVTGSTKAARYNSYKTLITNLLKGENISLNAIYHIGVGNTDALGNPGIRPADTGDAPYNDFISMIDTLFTRYEMGSIGQLVSGALQDTVKNVGIIQRWVLSYDSPFIESDGFNRQVIFSLTGLTNINNQNYNIIPHIKDKNKDRFYFVPQDKLEAYFIKPDPIARLIIKKDGKIRVEVRARSQYPEVQSDGSTKLVNYAIEKASFKLNGNGNQLILLSDKKEIEIDAISSGWYALTADLNADEYYSLFGDETIDIEATAATKYFGKTINLTTVKLTELDEPLITGIWLENETLKDFLLSLRDIRNYPLFNDNEIKNLSSIQFIKNEGFSLSDLTSIFSQVNNRLNIKLGDTINFEVTVLDESIKKFNNSKIYIASNEVSINKDENIYKGKTSINSSDLSMKISVQDDYGNFSSLKNNGLVEAFGILNIPDILPIVDFDDREYFSFVNTASTELGTALIKTKVINEESLAYFISFTYDPTQSDYGISDYDDLVLTLPDYPSIVEDKYWAVSKNGEFNLYDGKYISTNLYLINKAGAISNLSSNNLTNAFSELNTSTLSNRTFYVDTVPPRLINKSVIKIEDSNGIPVIDPSYPFKENDLITYSFEVEDFNYSNIELNFMEFMSKLLYTGESLVNNTTITVNKNFRVIFNQISRVEDITLSGLIYDKAENSLSTSLTGTYSSNLPKQMKFVEELYESSIKFTKDKDLVIDSFGSGENVSYAQVTLGSNGQNIINTLPTRLNIFGLSALENFYNIGTITTYSASGQKGIPFTDYIVVDTDINHNGLVEIVARKNNQGNFVATMRFDYIRELVGLDGFKVNSPSVVITNGIPNIVTGYYPLFGAGYFTTATASNIITSYNLQLPATKPQSIQVTLQDRFGNNKTFEQKIDYVDMVRIIGTSNNSERQISTTIEMGNNRKIIFREE